MVNNFKFGKRLISLALAASMALSMSGCSNSKFSSENEVNRVKNYLEDFMTDSGYVDLSNVSTEYDIKSFDGSTLKLALEEMDVSHVRITDSIIFGGDYVEGFPVMLAFNYDNLLGYDDNGEPVYETFEPIRMGTDDGVEYYYPKGFVLKEVMILKNPVLYEQLDNKEITVKQHSEDGYTLSLNKK